MTCDESSFAETFRSSCDECNVSSMKPEGLETPRFSKREPSENAMPSTDGEDVASDSDTQSTDVETTGSDTLSSDAPTTSASNSLETRSKEPLKVSDCDATSTTFCTAGRHATGNDAAGGNTPFSTDMLNMETMKVEPLSLKSKAMPCPVRKSRALIFKTDGIARVVVQDPANRAGESPTPPQTCNEGEMLGARARQPSATAHERASSAARASQPSTRVRATSRALSQQPSGKERATSRARSQQPTGRSQQPTGTDRAKSRDRAHQASAHDCAASRNHARQPGIASIISLPFQKGCGLNPWNDFKQIMEVLKYLEAQDMNEKRMNAQRIELQRIKNKRLDEVSNLGNQPATSQEVVTPQPETRGRTSLRTALSSKARAFVPRQAPADFASQSSGSKQQHRAFLEDIGLTR